MSKKLNIALKLQGPATEKGLIRLDDLLRELVALREALESIDRDFNGKSTLYYRVVNLSHRSPAKVVIEPVLKEKMKTPGLGGRWAHLPEKIHHSFFDTIKSIKKNDKLKLAKVGEPVIDAIADLLDGLGTEFISGSIANSRHKFNLDSDLKERVEKLLRPDYKSFGSVEGQLLAVNLARGNRFYIYPDAGPRSISCQFGETFFEKAQAALKRTVRVHGTKQFRDKDGFPFKITNVTDMEILPQRSEYPEFQPTKAPNKGLSSDELVRHSREEDWD